jgi:hypothetical protein
MFHPGGQDHEYSTRFKRTEDRNCNLDAVFKQYCNAVPTLYAAIEQSVGRPIGLSVQLTVGDILATGYKRYSVGPSTRPCFQ